MRERDKNLHVTIHIDDITFNVSTYPNEYRNLMFLIFDNIFEEGFGDCGGMGRCSTCLIEIVKIRQEFNQFNRNADQTMLRSGEQRAGCFLACQILADEFIDGMELRVVSSFR